MVCTTRFCVTAVWLVLHVLVPTVCLVLHVLVPAVCWYYTFIVLAIWLVLHVFCASGMVSTTRF